MTLSEFVSAESNTPSTEASWIDRLSEPTGFVSSIPWGEAARGPRPSEPSLSQDTIADAFARGEAAGRSAALAEKEADHAARDKLDLAFKTLDAAAAEALAAHLVETVSTLCAQIIEPHLIDKAALTERSDTLAQSIATAPEQCTLHIHPADRELIGEDISNGCRIHEDAGLERGALRLSGPDQSICDGPDLWRKAITQALSR